jgi:dihydroxyacetone kinase phosphoprotein-dependent L subunit
MLRRAAAAIIENKPLLTELDRRIGDGDHGMGMARGMSKGLEKLDQLPFGADVYEVFAAFGKAMLLSMGGASGVIFSSMFMDGAKGQLPTAALSPEDFAAMMGRGLAAIMERGKAGVGDKTMVDALAPAVEAMKECARLGYAAMLRAGEKAAAEGAEATRSMVARFGRAKSLMERAIGHRDAGAVSVHIILSAMAEEMKSDEIRMHRVK